MSESCVYAWQYVIATPLGSLYTFTLKEDVLREFSREVQHAMDEYIHHEFKSLEILEVLSGGKKRPVRLAENELKGLKIMPFRGYNMPYV